MAIEIPIPDAAFSEINITLSGISYDLIFKENPREKPSEESTGRLYFDIYTNNTLVKSGIKIMENQALIARYILDDFLHGELFCLIKNNATDIAVRGNIGLNKDYGLYYLTNEELEEEEADVL